jgi:hypothetical protein
VAFLLADQQKSTESGLKAHKFFVEMLMDIPSTNVNINNCPYFGGPISVYHSATACFWNAFTQIQTGMENMLDMIQCLSKLTLTLTECQAWQLPALFSFFHSHLMTNTISAHLSIG